MAWRISFERDTEKDLDRLGSVAARRILRFLHDRITPLENPRAVGEALKGPSLGDFWKYRVGSYRIIVEIQDQASTIIVVRIGDRRNIYRR